MAMAIELDETDTAEISARRTQAEAAQVNVGDAEPASGNRTADSFKRIGKLLTSDQILETMSSQAMRTRYLFGASGTDAQGIDGTMISQWLMKVWIELSRKGVTRSADVDSSQRNSDHIVRGWPSFIRAHDPRRIILRKIFDTSQKAMTLVDSGRLFMEPNGYMTPEHNGWVKYRDLTGAQATDIGTAPGTCPYVDFMIPAGAGLLFLGTRNDIYTDSVQRMYLIPGPSRIDRRELERLQDFLVHKRKLTSEMSELAKITERFGWNPPEVYIPITVLGYRAGNNTKEIDPSELGPEGVGSEGTPEEASSHISALEDPSYPVIIGGLYAFSPGAMHM